MYEQASTIASDAISNIRTVASFCAEEKMIESYRNKCEGPLTKGVRQGTISGVGYGFSFALLFCFYAVSFYVGARFVHNGTAEVGQVFKVRTKKLIGPNNTTETSSHCNFCFCFLKKCRSSFL
jgi:ATP-binding cassette subfamily B (MDR/TAP) protein 1